MIVICSKTKHNVHTSFNDIEKLYSMHKFNIFQTKSISIIFTRGMFKILRSLIIINFTAEFARMAIHHLIVLTYSAGCKYSDTTSFHPYNEHLMWAQSSCSPSLRFGVTQNQSLFNNSSTNIRMLVWCLVWSLVNTKLKHLSLHECDYNTSYHSIQFYLTQFNFGCCFGLTLTPIIQSGEWELFK